MAERRRQEQPYRRQPYRRQPYRTQPYRRQPCPEERGRAFPRASRFGAATLFSFVLLSTLASSCTLITNLDELQAPCAVDLTIVGFAAHPQQRFELQVLDENDQLQARAVLDPPGFVDYRIVMPDAVPAGPHRLEFAADFSDDGQIDNVGDHRWQIADACGGAPHTFEHVGMFTFFTTATPLGGDFSLTLSGMRVTNEPLEVQVRAIVDEPAGQEPATRTVGLYHTRSVVASDFTVNLQGIALPDADLLVSIWSDDNGNGAYDPPPTDEAWSVRIPAASASSAMFLHVAEYVDIGSAMFSTTDLGI